MLLRNVGSYKSHTASQPRRQHSSGITLLTGFNLSSAAFSIWSNVVRLTLITDFCATEDQEMP
jgi:hypothetical protein